MTYNTSEIIPVTITLLIIAVLFLVFVIKNIKHKHSGKALSRKNKRLRTAGTVLTVAWAFLLIPSVVLFVMAGVGAMMMEVTSDIAIFFNVVMTGLFWAMPIMAAVGVVLSFNYRKKDKYVLPLILQAVPMAALCLLIGVLATPAF
jgi:hypothetical protein